MASCGTPIPAPCASWGIDEPTRAPGRALVVLLLALAVTATAGCISISHGVMPHVDRLKSLQVGTSTTTDVLLLIGQPRGWGVARLRPELEPRDLWLYEFQTAEGSLLTGTESFEITMLVVFLRNDVYEGYLWFSSADTLRREIGLRREAQAAAPPGTTGGVP